MRVTTTVLVTIDRGDGNETRLRERQTVDLTRYAGPGPQRQAFVDSVSAAAGIVADRIQPSGGAR